MSVYLVGADDKSIFHKRTTWDFEQAIDAANPGDTIEIQKNFWISSTARVNKDLTIIGHVEKRENGNQTFTSGLSSCFVTDGATLILQDIGLSTAFEKHNTLSVAKGSTVIGKNILLENTATSGANYPIVYIEDHSEVQLTKATIKDSQVLDGKHKIFAENSKLEISDSYIGARVHLNSSCFSASNTSIVYHESNALFMEEQSKAVLTHVTLGGGKQAGNDFWANIQCNNSQITLNDCLVKQSNVNTTLSVSQGQAEIHNGRIFSANFVSSTILLDDVTFDASLAVEQESTLDATRIFIKGEDNGKINLFADKNSVVKADTIFFGSLSNPNIKTERDVRWNVGSLKQLKFDKENGQFVENDNSYIILPTQLDRTFFGQLTAFERLNQLIGIESVKEEVTEFIALAEMNKKRADQGLASTPMTLHSLFLGNPGTGKTTVARIVGEILYDKGIVSAKKFVEVSRADLVGQYIGATAQITRKKLDEALGGVLFIDEAYTLADGGKNDFGVEAINEILKYMEDHRSDIVIIFAGYTDSMQNFLSMNEGLKSRIPNTFHFEDYSVDELVQIGLLDLRSQKYKTDEVEYANLVSHNFAIDGDHSNGRWIRNLNEKIIRKLALRLSKNPNADISLIVPDDLNAVKL